MSKGNDLFAFYLLNKLAEFKGSCICAYVVHKNLYLAASLLAHSCVKIRPVTTVGIQRQCPLLFCAPQILLSPKKLF